MQIKDIAEKCIFEGKVSTITLIYQTRDKEYHDVRVVADSAKAFQYAWEIYCNNRQIKKEDVQICDAEPVFDVKDAIRFGERYIKLHEYRTLTKEPIITKENREIEMELEL